MGPAITVCTLCIPGQSTGLYEGSPFYLLYGRDPKLPVPEVLDPEPTRITVDLREYGADLHAKLSNAWEVARKCIRKSQQQQKAQYDKTSTAVPFRAGDRAFLSTIGENREARKLARPFHGPYRVIELDSNTATLRRVDRPEEEPMRVALTAYDVAQTKLVRNSGRLDKNVNELKSDNRRRNSRIVPRTVHRKLTDMRRRSHRRVAISKER